MRLRRYKSYPITSREKDPLIYDIEGAAFEAGIKSAKDVRRAARVEGLCAATPTNWFYGPTRRPQSATMRAFLRSIGYDLVVVKGHRRIAKK